MDGVAKPGAQRARREIEGICEDGLDWIALSEAVGRQIRKVVSYDGACWHTMDPATLLLTGNAVTNLPEGGLPVLAACEYGADDVNKWAFLARQPFVAGSLSAATQGQPQLSNRYRTLLQPVGLARELRVSFVENGACWGSAGFYRCAGEPDFTEDDERFIASIAQTLGLGYRRALVLDLLDDEHADDGPGLIVLDAENEVHAISAAAEAWIAKLPRETPHDQDLPLPILALTARARALGYHTEPTDVSARVRTPQGEWLVIRATPLRGGADGLLGVAIEPAGPPEIAQLLIAGYGLSQREQEVTYAVLRGASTREIADELSISPHTVQDHLKAIFEKLAVRSRRELVARIYSEHYLPHVAAGRSPTPGGWFGSGTKATRVAE